MIRSDALIRRKFYQYLMPGVRMVAAMRLGNVADDDAHSVPAAQEIA